MAAFLVFAWHFNHFNDGQVQGPLVFPLSLLTEGHTGVALFMTLSGYLFAKLLDGKKIIYGPFLLNRAIRLLPLLLIVLVGVGVQKYFSGDSLLGYLKQILKGAFLPTLPNGGWSLTVEAHFYMVLPILLWMFRKTVYAALLIICAAASIRLFIFTTGGEVQSYAYWTIIGRLDNFVLGMFFYGVNSAVFRHRFLSILAIIAFLAFWQYFDSIGGFYRNPSYPSDSILWVIIPTVEGIGYGLFIALYDTWMRPSDGLISNFVAKIGEYSYSIYLLHFFFVFRIPRFINKNILEIESPYLILALAVPAFLLMVPIGYLSNRLVETRFLFLRRPYTVKM